MLDKLLNVCIVLALILIFIAANVSAFHPDLLDTQHIEQRIRENAQLRWPTDLSMQAYEVKKQTEAGTRLGTFLQLAKEFKESNDESRQALGRALWEIGSQASDKYGLDFSMCVYEVNKQLKAAYELKYLDTLIQI